jgi:hypothetical protein
MVKNHMPHRSESNIKKRWDRLRMCALADRIRRDAAVAANGAALPATVFDLESKHSLVLLMFFCFFLFIFREICVRQAIL